MELNFNGVYGVVLRKLASWWDGDVDEKEVDEEFITYVLLDLIDEKVYKTLSAEVYDTLIEHGNNDSIDEEEAFKLFDEAKARAKYTRPKGFEKAKKTIQFPLK